MKNPYAQLVTKGSPLAKSSSNCPDWIKSIASLQNPCALSGTVERLIADCILSMASGRVVKTLQ